LYHPSRIFKHRGYFIISQSGTESNAVCPIAAHEISRRMGIVIENETGFEFFRYLRDMSVTETVTPPRCNLQINSPVRGQTSFFFRQNPRMS
jgi:hypothetical protein